MAEFDTTRPGGLQKWIGHVDAQLETGEKEFLRIRAAESEQWGAIRRVDADREKGYQELHGAIGEVAAALDQESGKRRGALDQLRGMIPDCEHCPRTVAVEAADEAAGKMTQVQRDRRDNIRTWVAILTLVLVALAALMPMLKDVAKGMVTP